MQSRALGARIAGILEAREDEADDSRSQTNDDSVAVEDQINGASSETDSANSPRTSRVQRRKHKTIIHTSPFLRCLQTSIGISAGISQYRGASAATKSPRSGSTATRTLNDGLSAPLSPTSKPVDSPSADKEEVKNVRDPGRADEKTLLRVDAFLGEWLSPDYYDQIMPPPNSVMMVTSAKAELLRRGEEIPRGNEGHSRSISGYFPGGWGSSSTPMSPEGDENDKARYNSAMSFALGQRHRAGSYDGPFNLASLGRSLLPKLSTDMNVSGDYGYTPPTPAYAMSPAEPIPPGYVAHARDACLEVDYQWDSMREPQNWGNGGEYGEEWSSMHTRFRNGLQKLVDWYRTHDCLDNGVPHCTRHPHRESTAGDEDDSDLVDTVLVLVTHGAGCNALIGALTNEPVLLDVGMASLTMAVRKEPSEPTEAGQVKSIATQRQQVEKSSKPRDTFLSEEYEVKVVASTEHLRAASNVASTSKSSSANVSVSVPPYRHRLGSRSSTKSDYFTISDSAARSYGIHRASSAGARQYPLNRGSSGLWGSISVNDGASESGDDIVPNFGDPKPAQGDKMQSEGGTNNPRGEEESWSKQLPEHTKSQRGLWGSVSMIDERDLGLKRRWTMTERRR